MSTSTQPAPTTRSTKRKDQSKRTKRKIYEAAVQEINQKGFNAVTIEDITTTAKVAKGSFYTHFKSKEDLVFSTLAFSDEIYKKAYQKVQNLAFLPMMTQFLRLSYPEYEKRGKGVLRAMISNYFAQEDQEYYGEDRILVQCLRGIVERGKRDGLLEKSISTQEYAQILLSTMIGVEVLWCFDKEGRSLADMMEQAMLITAKGMFR